MPLCLDFWSLDGAGAAYKQTGGDETVLVDRNDRPGPTRLRSCLVLKHFSTIFITSNLRTYA